MKEFPSASVFSAPSKPSLLGGMVGELLDDFGVHFGAWADPLDLFKKPKKGDLW